MKIIPAIDLMDGKVVRLYKGDPAQKTVYSTNPVDIALQWESQGADMLHIVDLDATLSLGSNRGTIQDIIQKVSIPVQVAGGLRSLDIVDEFLTKCDRVVIGTLAFKDPDNLIKLYLKHGPSKLVISVDHKDGKIVTHGWQQGTNADLIDSIQKFLKMGFTEFLLTNVTRDGTMQGPDLEYLEAACKLQNCNVIASGGVSEIKDIENVKLLEPYGVILGKALYENKISIAEAKKLS